MIGTGASAIQFIPEIQPQVAQMTVFQRTPPYIIPRPDREFSQLHHKVFERVPATQLVERGTWYGVVEGLSFAWVYSKPLAAAIKLRSRLHMRKQTKEKPGLFEKVWPDYQIGCKRILFSDDYLPALAQPNVDVVTDGIAEITPDRSGHGRRHRSTRPTSSSGAPASRPPSSSPRCRSRAATVATCTTTGARARVPTTA